MLYDVIIVGAGPAGSAAAQWLARKGYSVLLLDRSRFPRNKVCGDGLTPGATALLQELGALDALPVRERFPIRAIRFVTPKLRRLDVPFISKHEAAEFLVIPRRELDYALWQKAVQAGARFQVGTVTGVEKSTRTVRELSVRVNGKEQRVRARLILGADGASSVVARSLNKQKADPRHRFVAMRAYVSGLETIPGLVEFYWTNELKPGYFWIFPLGKGKANVGLGLPADLYAKSTLKLKDLFLEYLNGPLLQTRHKVPLRVEDARSWPIPLGGVRAFKRVDDGIMLIGDAGYWSDPLSGEGIHNALQTAKIAAEVADLALHKGRTDRAFLQAYEEKAKRELGPTIRRSLWFVWGMRHLPWLLEWYFALAGRSAWAFQKFFSNLSHDFQFDFEKTS